MSVDISVVEVDDRESEMEGRIGSRRSAEVDDQTDVDVVALR